MADYSEHYNLKKPLQEDFYNVDDFNDNADKIDAALYAADVKLGQAAQESTLEDVKTDVAVVKADIADVKSNAAAVSNKIGTATDTGGSDKAGTVMGKLNNLISIMISELISKYPPEEYTTAGTYKTTVPSLAKSVTITACGAGGGSLNSEFGAGGNGGKGTVYVTGGSEYYSHGDDGKPGYVKLIWNF